MRKKFLLMTFLLAIIGFCGTNLRAEGDLQIATETALREFANAVNSGESYEGRSVTLTDDITLTGEWTPIGNGSRSSKTYTGNSFKGTFDGGNHTISGLTITSTTADDAAIGLFGVVDGGTVKNLKLTNVNISTSSKNVGGAAGLMVNNATIDKVEVYGTLTAPDGVGGIVGRMIIDGTISNCTNNATVTATTAAGGIVGKAYYSALNKTMNITGCTNNGNITGSYAAGGIAALSAANISNCSNTAVIASNEAGGIVGEQIMYGTINNNINSGLIKNINNDGFAHGGIIGWVRYHESTTNYPLNGIINVTNNTNTANIEATGATGGSGGIVGHIYNQANVTGNTNKAEHIYGGVFAAGIAGSLQQATGNLDIENTTITVSNNISLTSIENITVNGSCKDLFAYNNDAANFVVKDNIFPIAKIGDNYYATLAEAAAAAQAGDEIVMLSDVTLDAETILPAGVIFNGNGKQVSGTIIAGGEITFKGVTKAASFNVKNVNTVVNIPAGASLQLTGTGRMVIGHGCTFNITGSIADNAAKTADKATLTPSLVMPGASFTGAGVTFNVTNAYISAPSSYCSSSSSASGTFDFDITNSIWESAGKLAFESQSTAATVNFDLVESVLNTGSHLVFGVSRGEVVIDNSNVNVGTSRQIENRSTMTIKNGSVVNGAVATSSNAINPGTIIVENATYAVTGEFSGAAEGTGTLVIKEGANVSVGSIKAGANVTVDAEGMAAGDEINFTADLSQFTGTLSVINNDKLEAKIVDGKIVLTAKPVAKIGEQEYMTLEAAFAAATSGCTIDILSDVTVDYNWDARYTGGKFTVPVTINGNDKTIKFTASVNDNNYQAPFRFEADATVKNLTIDMSEVTDNRFRAISSKGNLTVDDCKFIGKDETLNCRAIIFGEGAGANVGNLAIYITNSEFFNWKRGITDNENAQDVKTVTITGNTLTDAGVGISAKETVTFTGNTVTGAYVNITSYTAGNKLAVTATGNTLEANTETAYNVINAGGKVEADDAFNVVAKGNDFTGYTGVDAIWGETWGNASESFVIKVLDANGNVMGTTSLNNIGGIIDGDVNVTWNIKLDAASNTDEYWTMAWTTAPTINNMPAKVELWVDGVKVSGGNVVLNGPDEINKIYAAVTDNDGKIYSYHTSIANAVDAITGTRSVTPNVIALLRNTDETVTLPAGITLNLNGFTAANVSVPVAQIGETPYYTLAEAVAAAESGATITLLNGEHELPLFANKELTFVGESKEGVIVNDAPAAVTQGWNGSTFHFENLTAKGATENYHGLANGVKAVTYNNCKINGLRFLYATNGVSFEDCTFNAEGVEHSFWTYGASNVTVKNSTFTYTDRAVNCYSENGANHELDITFEGCSFTYAGTNDDPEGAVEINSGSVKSIDLVMNGCTAPENGEMWFNSQWDSKKGENTVVKVDGEIVWQVLPVAKIGDVEYKSLQAALDAAAAGTGNVTVEILRNIDLTGIDWNPVTVSDPGYPSVTVNGNDKTITGLNDMLFAGTWAGNSGLIINDLTIDESNIVHDENDSAGNIGVGAFIGFPQASATITLNNCHLKDSKVEGGHWTGGLIGYAAGYAGTDGPVFMNLTITDCSVTGSTITGNGSAGGIIGHGSGNAWTNVVIKETTVSGNNITSTGTSTNKAGAIMGTIGAAGQPTTVNGVTHTGGATVSATVSGNTVKSNNVVITTIYGRQGTGTGMLELNGGSYDNYPIEEGVAYAAPAEGYKIEDNGNGTYGVVVDPAYGKVAKVGDVYYETLAEAYNAATDGQTITLLNNITLSEKFVIAKSITLDGNDKTLTYTGSNRAIDIYDESNNVAEVTIKNLIVEFTSEYCERGINYNESGNLTLDKVTINGIGEERALTYAINLPGYSDNANVTITNSNLNGYGVLNIWGTDVTVNVENSTLHAHNHISGGPNTFAAIVLNSNPSINEIANGTVVNVNGGKIITSRGEGCETMSVGRIDSETGVINISTETVIENNGGVEEYIEYSVARDNGGVIYNSLQDAIDVAQTGATITIIRDFNIDTIITVAAGKELTIDLNGKTITGTDNTTKNFSIIDNRGNLTITDSSDPSTGKITLTATIDSDWNRYSAVIANNPGGKLTIEAGTLEHLGGTDMAYGIDNLTNGKGTYAETVINGGTIKSTYRGIRQFLNGTEAQNILTVNGGTIEGVNKSIWMQDPNKNANTGTLTVGEEANLIGNVYLYVTPNSTSWPVEVSIAAGALAEGSEIITGNVPAGYELKLVDGVYGVCSVEAKIGEVTYATLAAAVNAANEGDTITLVTDITFTEATRTLNSGSWYDGLYYIGDKSFTIDLNSYTIGHDNSVNDYLLNFKNNGAKANVINLINGTIEAGSTAYCALATSSSNTNKITINTENINIINNNSNGSTIKVRGGVELNVNAGTVITGKNSYLGIECVASTVNIYDGAEIYMNGNTSYNGCLVGACANGTVNVYGGYGEGVKGGFIAMTSGGTINVAGGEWIANTDGTVGNNSNLYVLTAQNNKNESGYAGASIINVTGGTFRGGMDAWILNDANVEKAELNISGGNFNADPTSYVDLNNYKVVNEDDGTYTVEVDGFEKFYTAAGVETTSDDAAYSLSFTVTDYASKEVSVKIGSKNPAENKGCDLLIPSSVKFNDQDFAVTSIPVDGFNACKGFDKLVVPGTITSVSNSAFYNCSKLTEVVIEEGVQKLGSNTFYKISNLQTLTLPSTLTRIESLCFNGTHSIETIVCNAQTPPTAFTGSFTEAVYKNALLYVDGKYEDYKAANGWSNFKNILAVGATQTIDKDRYTLIATITDVWNRTCSVQIGTAPTNTKRAELAIPEHVSFSGIEFDITSIPEGGFQDCKYFEGTLTIPAYITSIGKNAFEGCSGVTALVVEEGVTSLGTSDTFNGCRNIETITLPSTLTKIPTRCFHNILQKLQVVECHALVPPTLASQFTQEAYNSATLYVHDVDAYKGANNWKSFKSIRLIGAVAQNKETEVEYKSIAEAVAAANAGETVQMLQNVDLENTITVAAGKEVVLDLNGKTVSYTTTEHKGEAMITNNGNLTITDTSDEETGSLSYAYEGGADSSYGFGNSTIENKGVLTINAGTVENTSAAMSHASYAINTGAGATLNVEGGNILNLNGHAVRMVSFGTELNTVNINGGYIEGTRALQVQLPGSASSTTKPAMDLNITGGELMSNEETYNLAIYVFSNGQSAENVSVEISGGTFNGNVAVNAAATNSMLANAVAITDGTFNGEWGVFSYADDEVAVPVISITGGTFATNYSEFYAADEQYVFEQNENGTYSVVEQTIFTQTRELAQGWNWFSYYVNTDLTALETALGENGVQITSKTDGFVAYNSQYGWSGNLSSITESQMYMINVGASHDLELSGELVGPTSITLHQGWNWIGFPMSEAVSVTDALAGFEAKSGDQIKSKDNGFASYNSQYGWGGTLSTLNPGEGYMYQSNNSETTELFYSAGTRGELKANVTTDGNHWIPNAGQYPNNMTMTAMVEVEGGDYEVAAFVNGECRGSARPIYIEALDAHILFLTIHGEDVEEMTFRYYDIATGEDFELNDRINYSNDAIVGTLAEPYIFSRGTTGIGEVSLSEVNIYPNPTTTGTEINLQATCDTVEVFNALGVKVAEYHNVDSIDAFETAGIYVIRITDNGDVKHCRLIVK